MSSPMTNVHASSSSSLSESGNWCKEVRLVDPSTVEALLQAASGSDDFDGSFLEDENVEEVDETEAVPFLIPDGCSVSQAGELLPTR